MKENIMGYQITVDELMLGSAVRYALGRSTYIVSATTEQVKKVWNDLSEKTQFTIHRDVREALNGSNKLGMDMDHKEWVALAEFMEASVPSLK